MANKKRKRYNKGKRVDMRQGGRVALAEGRRPIDEEQMIQEMSMPSNQQQQQQQVPLGDPRVPSTGGRKGVNAPRTPEELKELEQLSYVAGRTPTTSQQQQQVPLGDPRVSTGGKGSFSKSDLFDPTTGELLTPEERKEKLERLSYIASPTRQQQPQAQVEAGDIQTDITPEERRAAQAALRAEGLGRGLGMPGGPTATTTTVAPIDSDTPLEELTPEQQKQLFEQERGARIIETGRTAEQIAAGEIPEGMIPEAKLEEVDMDPEMYESEAIQLAQRKGIDPQLVKDIGFEAVRQMEDIKRAATPEEIQAARYQADIINQTPKIKAAESLITDQELAQAAQVERVAPIEGASIEIPEGALTERIIGTLSEEAKATAVKNVGTSLARITRAKKQLLKAGLSEEEIAVIGNDPEDLEARLADFTEEERGIIEGLPEEALVSTQMNALLEGIEDGQVPLWARPAVAQVEQMLAQRGMSASTVGRDALLNTILQAAMPIAQSNAQAIQASVAQQKTIEAQVSEANAARMQQVALTNAQNVFQMDMAQFSADVQVGLSNSKFLQTVGITEANLDQQATIQNAVLMSQANLAEADFNQQAQINNAKAFLNMNLANLNNRQQEQVIKAQQEQQRLLSNQAASNAARQFNATSEQQTQQFMASLKANIDQFNTREMNAAQQFNVQQANAMASQRMGLEFEQNKANAAIINQTRQYNQQLEFQRQQWNAANEQAVLQSNVEWRRKANLANTVAQNEINRQNVQNAFGLSSSAQSFLWQELRDQADYDFRWATDSANRKTQAMIAAASAEGDAAKTWSANFQNASSVIDRLFGTGGP